MPASLSSRVSFLQLCKVLEVIIVLTNIYSVLSNYLSAFISGALSKGSAPSHCIISSHLPDSVLSAPTPLKHSLALSSFHPPEYAVKLCFALLSSPGGSRVPFSCSAV